MENAEHPSLFSERKKKRLFSKLCWYTNTPSCTFLFKQENSRNTELKLEYPHGNSTQLSLSVFKWQSDCQGWFLQASPPPANSFPSPLIWQGWLHSATQGLRCGITRDYSTSLECFKFIKHLLICKSNISSPPLVTEFAATLSFNSFSKVTLNKENVSRWSWWNTIWALLSERLFNLHSDNIHARLARWKSAKNNASRFLFGNMK